MQPNGKGPAVLALDAGGTMTDAFVVDRNGQFVVGKALTTPDNESIGVVNSLSPVNHGANRSG